MAKHSNPEGSSTDSVAQPEVGGPTLKWLDGRPIAVPITFARQIPNDECQVLTTFDVVDGQLSCRELRVIAREGGPEVKRSFVAGISIDDLREEVASKMLLDPESFRWPEPSDSSRRGANVAHVRAIRRKTDADTLRQVAEVYLANELTPTRAVQDHFGIAHRTASLYVKRARDAGLLPAYRSGNAGDGK